MYGKVNYCDREIEITPSASPYDVWDYLTVMNQLIKEDNFNERELIKRLNSQLSGTNGDKNESSKINSTSL